jgi:hypothetical protein
MVGAEGPEPVIHLYKALESAPEFGGVSQQDPAALAGRPLYPYRFGELCSETLILRAM